MKVTKTLHLPWGGCSEEIVWTVGEDHCYLIGTYPEHIVKKLATDKIGGEPAWQVLLNLIGKNLLYNT